MKAFTLIIAAIALAGCTQSSDTAADATVVTLPHSRAVAETRYGFVQTFAFDGCEYLAIESYNFNGAVGASLIHSASCRNPIHARDAAR